MAMAMAMAMAMPPPAMATARATARPTAMALAMDMVWPVSCLFLRCSGARHGLGVVLGATMFFSRGKRLCDYLSVGVGREPDDRGVVLLIGARRQKNSRVPAEFPRNSPRGRGGIPAFPPCARYFSRAHSPQNSPRDGSA